MEVDNLTHEELLLFGERLRNRRNALGLTQEFVSDKIGKGLRFYQMIERGEKGVSLDTLVRLSQVLTISTDYLLLGDLRDSLGNPIMDVFNGLSGQQQEDAIKILQLYAKACHD